ncbi:hypothetical protein PGKDCPLP_04212 [Stenotrophomonas maltophilia]|nr:hypothetical protein PGKDCPLP_04212 [Stenotrophomonas maltophilia]
MGRERDALHALLQLQAATCDRLAPLAIAVAQVHLVVAHLAVLPVLVVARRDVDAVDHPALAEADHPLMRTGAHGLVAHTAEPCGRIVVEGIFQRMARLFGRAVDHQQAVGRQFAAQHRRSRIGIVGGRSGHREVQLQLQRLADVLGGGTHVQRATALLGIEVPAFSRTVERRRIGQRRQRAATGLHRTRCLAAEHAQAITTLRQLAVVLALHRIDLHLHRATALRRRLHADYLRARLTLLVAARVAIVFVQRVLRLALRVQVERHFIERLLAIEQHRRVHRQDRTGTHEHRQRGQVHLAVELAAIGGGLHAAAVPVVDPAAGRQMDVAAPATAGGLAAVHRRHQQVAAEQELVLVGFILRMRVARVVPHQATHRRCTGLRSLVHQPVHVGGQAHLQLQVIAVDAAVGLVVPPRVLARVRRPAAHAHQHRGEGLPLQVAGEGLGAAAEDRIDVAAGVGHAGQPRTDQGRYVPADVIPAAALVAGPCHGIALDAGPAHHRPQERARIGIVEDAVECLAVGVHRELVALAGPGHVQLLHAAAGLAHFPGDLVDAVLGPQAGAETILGQALHRFRQLLVTAAVTIIGQDPATGHVVGAVLLGHAVDHIRGGAGRAVAPAFGHGAGLLAVVAVVVAIGIAVGQRPARDHVGAAGQLGVALDQFRQVGADEVVRIEAVFAVQQRGLVGLAQIVAAIAPGIAQHAPATAAQQHRRRAGAVALFPAAGVGHFQLAALELVTAVLLAATVIAFIGLRGQHLHALRGIQVQRLQFLPQRGGLTVVQALQAQAQRLPLHMQHQRIGAYADFLRVFFQLRLHVRLGLRQHDRRGLVAGAGQRAVAAGLHADDVGGRQFDADARALVGLQIPALHAVAAGAGADRTQVADRLGPGRHGRQHQCRQQAQHQRRATNADFHADSQPVHRAFRKRLGRL